MAKKTKYSHLSREQIEAKLEKLERERYGLVWEDKEEDVVKQCETELPVLKEDTSREIVSDTTKPYNFIIEGDNYHSLYTLNFTHKKKIDVIYIDPPYNTGKKNEWKYNDHWVDENDSYRHSKWLSFMNKRLRLAKNLLKDTGVIFISIDDNEQAPLKMLLDKIFGESNFVACMIRQGKAGAGHDAKEFAIEFDYALIYSKNKEKLIINKEKVDAKNDPKYKLSDDFIQERGKYYLRDLDYKGSYSPSLDYPILLKNGKTIYAGGKYGAPNTWRWSESKLKWGIENHFIVFKNEKVYMKQYQFVDNDGNVRERYLPFRALTKFLNSKGSEELTKLGLSSKFKFPKPTNFINYLLESATTKNSLVLDFFAGSGTTGHAILELNKEDGGNRRFILCTNNESNICEEVTYPRIKKVIEGYADQEGIPANVKYFKQTFVPNVTSDKDKRELVNRSTELLCMAENTFENVVKRSAKSEFAIFKNATQQTAIIYDEESIEKCVNKLNSINSFLETVIYVFSYDHNYDEENFENLKVKFSVKPIPEAILNIYRKIAKMRKK